MKKFYGVLIASVALLQAICGTASAQTNPLAVSKRFIRGVADNPPVLQSFVIPLDFEKGVELDAQGDNAAKFPDGPPWFTQIPRYQSYHFGVTNNTIDYLATPFQNPIVAFGSAAGGSSLYVNRTYRFGVHGGPTVQEGNANPYAYKIWISAYRKSDLQYMNTLYIVLPRRNTTDSIEKSKWDSYVNNGFVWPTPEYPLDDFYGLRTTVELVEGGISAPGWGLSTMPYFWPDKATYEGYVITHTCDSSDYYFKVESYSFFPINTGGADAAYYPMAGTITDNTLYAAPSNLYVMNFDQAPAWRSTALQLPQFQGEPMPSEYVGKSLQELRGAQTTVSQTVSGSPSSYTQIDNNPELRMHPILNQLVDKLTGTGQTPEGKAIALANFVQNEIQLADPLDYNESGNISETSINEGGVKRGALATYLEGQGSPSEQCALLVYLLRRAGLSATYMFPEQNKLKMLDVRMSSILRFQVKGLVDNFGNTEQPYDPAAPSLIPVNYPWVAVYINNQWVHFFPWIKDTEIVEGYNLYDYLPDGYKNGHQWIRKYLDGDPAILNLDSEDQTPANLFPKFIADRLKANHPELSLDDMGVRIKNRRNYYSRLIDFPKPFSLTGTPQTVESLQARTNCFDTIKIKIASAQDSTKKIEIDELPVLEFHNRKLLLRQTKVNATTHSFSLTLAPFRTGTTVTSDFTNTFANLVNKQVKTGSVNLTTTDKNLTVEVTVNRHKRFYNSFTAPTDRWLAYMGFNSEPSTAESFSINKGDLSAICINLGRVSNRMLEEHAKEIWRMSQDAIANPTTQDPDIYQGTTAYLMGMSYYNKVDTFADQNAALHKRLLIGNIGFGLATLKAQYVSGQLPNGDITYVQPYVDMFYHDTASVGNDALRPDSGQEAVPGKKDFEAINITAGSAMEHQVINSYFKTGDAISTVELLRIAKQNPATYPDGFYELTYNTYLNYDAAMSGYDPTLWSQVKSNFETPTFGKYIKAYITSKPVTGASGSFTGMGALIFGPNSWGALISNKLNGGAGPSFSIPSAFSNSNVANLSLSLDTTPNSSPIYSFSYEAPTPSSPILTSPVAATWNYTSIYDTIVSGSSLVDAYLNTALGQSNTLLNYTPAGTGSTALANSYKQTESSGSISTTSWYGDFTSLISDPVHSVTGEFYINVVDLRLNGPMPLEVRRNYGSQNMAENEFGYGWKLAYFPYLVVATDHILIYAAEMDGSVIAYRQQTSTQWKPVAADNPNLSNMTGEMAGSVSNMFNARIDKTTEGTDTIYTLAGPDGSLRRFVVKSFPTGGTNGVTRQRPYLDKWTDNRGNYFQFTFETDSTQPGYGEVRRIDASNGNFVGFEYDTFSHITEAYSGDGRRLHYRYDAYGDLVEVTWPDATVWTYDYQHATQVVSGKSEPYSEHLIIRENKPNGRILENDYDSFRRVKEQRSTVGMDLIPVRNATFTYTVTATNSDNTINGSTVIKDAYDRETRYDFTNSQITIITDPAPLNYTITQEWYQPGDNTTGAYPRSLKKRIDKRGLVSEFQYDTRGNLIQATVTGDITGDGLSDTAVTTCSYSSLNLPTLVVDPTGNRTATYYENVAYPWLPTRVEKRTATTLVNQTAYEYYSVTQNGLTAKGLLQRQKSAQSFSDEAVTEWTHNEHGFPVTETRHTGTTDPNIVTTFSYNLRGELVESKDALNRTIKFDYNGQGRRTWQERHDESGALVWWQGDYFNPNGELEWSDGSRYSPEDYVWRIYDGAGRPKEVLTWRSQAKADGSGVEALAGDNLYATTFYTHDLFGNLLEVKDARHNSTVMTYDEIGRMKTRTAYEGNSSGTQLAQESFEYEAGGQVRQITNSLGGVTKKFYTANGKIRRQENPDGTILEWRYQLDGRIAQEPVNHNTYYEIAYDDVARTITKTLKDKGNATLATEVKTFDRRGNCVSEQNRAGDVFTRSFDGLDRVKIVTGPTATSNTAQQTTTTTYDNCGKVTTVTNGLSEKSITTTDALGRPITVETRSAANALVHKTSYTYSADFNSVTVTEGTGTTAMTSTVYTDTQNQEVLKVLGAGDKRFTVRDELENAVKQTDELGQVTNNTFDALNRLKTQTLPGGANTTFVYNGMGNLLERRMPGGLTWVATYDNAGRKKTEQLQNGAAVTRNFTYTYSSTGISTGLLQTLSDPRGITFTTTYDAFLRTASVTTSGSQSEQNENLTYGYDLHNLPTSIGQTGGGQPATTIHRTFDAYGQLTDETIYIDGAVASTFSQKWNEAGRRAELRSPDSSLTAPLLSFTWRADGLLSGLTANGQSSLFAYNDNGLLTSKSNSYRSETITQRDARGRITDRAVTVGSATPLAEHMAWRANSTLDASGYTATRSGTGAWNEIRSYSYNSRGQLLSESFSPASGQLATASYEFDGGTAGTGVGVHTKTAVTGMSLGNWSVPDGQPDTLARILQESVGSTSKTIPMGGMAVGAQSVSVKLDGYALPGVQYDGWQSNGAWSVTVDVPTGTHSVTVVGTHPSGYQSPAVTNTFSVVTAALTATNSYDLAGNVQTRSWSDGRSQTLTWDARGSLVKVTQRDGDSNGFDWSAIYDGLGRRLRTVYQPIVNNVATGTAQTINSWFDPQVEFLEIGLDINGVRTWKVYGVDLSGRYGGYQGIGGLEATITQGGSTVGVINDYFGNVVATSNGTAATWKSSQFGAYGSLPGSWSPSFAQSSSVTEVTGWRTRRIDETGLIWSGTRYYEPVSARFLSVDPMGHGISMSLYDYANMDGANFCDPDGRFATAAYNNTLGNTRVQGGLMIGQGVVEAMGAGALFVTPEPTLLTKVGGAALLAHGSDVAAAGWSQLWTGNPTQSLTSQGISGGLQYAGVDPYYANMTGGMFDATMGAVAGRVMLPTTSTVNLGNVSISAPEATPNTVRVTSWAGEGATPDLNPGRWVVKGDASTWNFIKTGLWGPKTSTEFPFVQPPKGPFTPITQDIPASSLVMPKTTIDEPFAVIKGWFGQYKIGGE